VTVLENGEKTGLGEKLNDFLQKKRRGLFISLITIVVLLAGFMAGLSIRNTLRNKAVSKVEDFGRRYETLRVDINDSAREGEVTALLEELGAFAEKSFGYASARAYSIRAGIYADQKNWAEAEKAWLAAANQAAKSYLEPVSLYNAAVAAEEQDNAERAIELYTKSLQGESFPAAARSQFAVGRLEESRNNTEAALAAYRALISRWPEDSIWTNLAQSRVIALSAAN
jgi:tetratricopeptide (TPR) repeat protein